MMVTALKYKEEHWTLPPQLYEAEGQVAEYIICDSCGTYWSPEKDDYQWLNDDDSLVCSCGEHLCKKSELN